MSGTTPFDDIRGLVTKFQGPDRTVAHLSGSDEAGRGGEMLRWLAGWTHRTPRIDRPLVAVFAATHGLAERVKPGTAGRVRAAVEEISGGHAAVNRACAASDLGLKVFDLALDIPTGDITAGPALGEKACAATMAFGMEAIAGGTDILVLGSCGEGGEIAATAVLSALMPEEVAAEFGQLPPAIRSGVEAALSVNRGLLDDPLHVLRALGGREIAALAGAIVAARLEKVPVLLDGIAAVAAAAVVHGLARDGVDHCMLGDAGAIGLQRAAAGALGLDHVLDFGAGDGSGAGGAIAVAALKALVAAAREQGPAGTTH